MTSLLWAVPWLLFFAITPLFLRRRPQLRSYPQAARNSPLVSVIVPARNEAHNIGICLSTLLNTSYGSCEVIVVDDGSSDGTADIARLLARRSRISVKVIETPPLPPGWIGKCWACHTGYQQARGELLLFTDADTRHDDELLPLAVGALQSCDAGMVTVLPRQIVESFWERVVLPHIFFVLQISFAGIYGMDRTRNPRRVIGNGQFMLFRRDVYEKLGGHQAIKAEVCDDLVMAQRTIANGQRMLLAFATDVMETRMYHSLGEIVEGWSKNLARGGLLTLGPVFGRIAIWLGAVLLIAAWVLPVVVLVAGIFVGALAPFRLAAAAITATSLLFWLCLYAYFGVKLSTSLAFPLGALVSAFLMIRSSVRGNRVAWRGREYRLGVD
jgi:chlorobactene glucosyltransferase